MQPSLVVHSLSLCLCLSLFLSVCVSPCLSFYLSVCVSLFLCVCVCFSLCLSLFLSLPLVSFLKIAAAFSSQEQKLYASAGAVAEEVLGSVRTVVAFGGEFKESARCSNELFLCTQIKLNHEIHFDCGCYML